MEKQYLVRKIVSYLGSATVSCLMLVAHKYPYEKVAICLLYSQRITTSGMFTLAPLACLLQNDFDRPVLYSVDYPFSANETGLKFFHEIKKSGLIAGDDLRSSRFGMLLKAKHHYLTYCSLPFCVFKVLELSTRPSFLAIACLQLAIQHKFSLAIELHKVALCTAAHLPHLLNFHHLA